MDGGGVDGYHQIDERHGRCHASMSPMSLCVCCRSNGANRIQRSRVELKRMESSLRDMAKGPQAGRGAARRRFRGDFRVSMPENADVTQRLIKRQRRASDATRLGSVVR